METKPLLYGLIGFFLGGLLVSIAAHTFDRSELQDVHMDSMTASFEGKRGDQYDTAWMTAMIEHHESAVNMAQSAQSNTKNTDILRLSDEIIKTQTDEINQMKAWQTKNNAEIHTGH